jgi:polysaccharide export outer membrane protein
MQNDIASIGSRSNSMRKVQGRFYTFPRLWIAAILLFACAALSAQNDANERKDPEYLLKKGDKISVVVMEHPEFSREIQVMPDGTIEYPLLGNIYVIGLMPAELAQLIKDNIGPFVAKPVVTVYVTEIHGQSINIIGYVNKPGSFQIFESVDLLSALSLAGGIKNGERIKILTLIRKNGEVIRIPMSDVLAGHQETEYGVTLSMEAGDTLIAVAPRSINWGIISSLISLLSLGVQVLIYADRISN